MTRFQSFEVYPAIPEPLAFLETLSRNLWWSWQYDAKELFRRIDPTLWKGPARRNPIAFLGMIPQKRLKELAKDDSFLAHQQRVRGRFDSIFHPPAKQLRIPLEQKSTIAYFSMEFGIHESLPLYAGGLGMLAGDHLKAASDNEVPMVAVGLLYRHGYFLQFLNQDGVQQEEYPETDLFLLPLERALDQNGKQFYVTVEGPEGNIRAIVWKITVGRVPLFLLDANLPENAPEARKITSTLYAVEPKLRLAQELLLGIGGMRALYAMGIEPSVCHMNEGHSAFAAVERICRVVETHHIDLKTALEVVPRSNIFTTHTPVAAGYDDFPAELVRPCLTPLQETLKAEKDEILSWGQAAGSSADSPLSMFILGLRLSQYCNGVSELHGRVARRMWAHVWPGRPQEEVPIGHITNGVHGPSWISHELAQLFERYIGPDWNQLSSHNDVQKRIDEIYDEELWRAHEMTRTLLVRFCRDRMIRQYARRNAPKAIMENVGSVLDQDILTIGFARRFATYKRSYLLLKDPERLEALITSKDQPVQFIFAGKAHPRDNEGKDLIKTLIQFAHKESVRHRFVFLEDYDPDIARHMVRGTDVWLNTPRRPLEACGTSGMKAAMNGVLNVSVLDGWWCEGYSEDRGWRIGSGEEYADPGFQDEVESRALFNILENDVIPCFYDRKNGDVPIRWLKMMKASIKMAVQDFCSHKMTDHYARRYYYPAAKRFRELLENEATEARQLRERKIRLQTHWNQIKIEQPGILAANPCRVGENFRVTATLHLKDLKPEDVDVELYYGLLKSVDSLTDALKEQMTMEEDLGDGEYRYASNISCNFSGRFGCTARVTPRGDDLIKFTPGLITWA